jgi:hypothetical protein
MTSAATADRICKYRTAKVVAILAAIRRLEHDSDTYAQLVETGDTDGVRQLIVATAGVNKPSEDTWAMVTELVRRNGTYAA